jgi:hypothetical protein
MLMAKRKRTFTAYQHKRHRYWRQMILKWRQSGLSQAAFCRRTRLQMQQLSKWKIRLAAISKGGSAAAVSPDFIEVKPQVTPPVYEIITPGEYRIRIEGDYQPDVLAGILSMVSRVC